MAALALQGRDHHFDRSASAEIGYSDGRTCRQVFPEELCPDEVHFFFPGEIRYEDRGRYDLGHVSACFLQISCDLPQDVSCLLPHGQAGVVRDGAANKDKTVLSR